MYKFLSLIFSLITLVSFSQEKISVIPQPLKVVEKNGVFVLPKTISVSAPQNSELATTVDILREKLSTATGFVTVRSTIQNPTIKLTLNKTADKTIGDEGYNLLVTAAGIKISANKPAGIFYGVQTLLQLLPPQIESNSLVKNVQWSVPQVEISDYPQFAWRGIMLDVARHFFTVDEVKKVLDQMAAYKLNLMHFHLVDDEGWRIEIKSLPKLTEIGAWRAPTEGDFGEMPAPAKDAPRTYGGFYTQEQLKDLVKYAKERFIDIMPEIDMPGHSMALLSAYPELSCTPNLKVSPRTGQKFLDWGTHTLLVDNTLCPAKEEVYDVIDKIVGEVATIFPFEYYHSGGDEAFYTYWEKSNAVKALMQKENLKTLKAVQGYFEKRVEKIVNKHGKKMMGWDEIYGAGVEKSTAIMGWRGDGEEGIKASNNGHKVVMSPAKYAYIDFMQGDKVTEPHVYATLRLKNAYQFNPSPEGANRENILGGQANLWAEQIYNIRQMEYMLWPRTFALAESVWSPQSAKNWNKFVSKVENQMERLDYAKVKYSPAMYDPIVSVKKQDNGEIAVTLTPEIEGLEFHYSFDNSWPDNYYPTYKAPLTFPLGADNLKVISYKKGEEKPAGRLLILTKEDLTKRAR